MSDLLTELNNDLKSAMREKNALNLSVLRMLLASLKNKIISLTGQDKLSDDEIMAVIKSEVKKRKDSVVAYTEGGRQDLADQENAEIEILNKYLPVAMSDEELEKIVREVVSSIEGASMAKFGVIMGQVMAKAKGADGNAVSSMVKKVLA
ncbi:MAG: GatB/YqeY domain-containing protein [Candidatus Magasanikbacteria bacterium]|nr:GatB/YqeY domain-containing protein [Candidatus Magasanikbacteria bacterium]